MKAYFSAQFREISGLVLSDLRDVVEIRVAGIDRQFAAFGDGRDETVTGGYCDSLPSQL